MTKSLTRMLRPARAIAPLAALAVLAIPAACAQGITQPATLTQQDTSPMAHPNSIQPETTITINATGNVDVAPDIAFISTGVQSEADTAQEAMADNRAAMNGVFNALTAAGIEQRHIQTSNFSLGPRYEYIEHNNETGARNQRVLVGYNVSNQVTAKITDLDTLGATLDALVEAGGNTFNGITFGLEDDSETRDEARRLAMQTAMQRAQLYADAAGLQVARIVTINEYESRGGPQPMARARMESADMANTPISGGEVGYSVQVSVMFELEQ